MCHVGCAGCKDMRCAGGCLPSDSAHATTNTSPQSVVKYSHVSEEALLPAAACNTASSCTTTVTPVQSMPQPEDQTNASAAHVSKKQRPSSAPRVAKACAVCGGCTGVHRHRKLRVLLDDRC